MTCAGCGFEAQPSFAFCPRCGTRLPQVCPGCGSACAPDFAFCPRCGGRLAAAPAPAPAATGAAPPKAVATPPGGAPAAIGDGAASGSDEADRRQVTVVFADLSGFTALSERLDAEEIRALQGELFREAAEAIERYEGFVEKFVGDAVMAVFGAPVAHEDDPERALRAALLIHERAAVLNQRWADRLGQPLVLHIGINTGPVVAGTLGPGSKAAYAVTGDTVNTAARLLSAAPAGQTLVSATTCQITRHAFDFEPVGPVEAKGKALPLAAYRLVGLAAAPGSARGLDALGLVAPLVGRRDELRQMLDAFERMRQGRAQGVSLVGEPGVGKSRLLHEFLATLERGARLDGVAVRSASCSSLGGQPYGVLVTFFREAYGVGPDDTLDTIREKLTSGLLALGGDEEEPARIAPLLAYLLGLGASGPLEHLEPEQLKRQLFLALRRLVERRLLQGPLLLVVEDAHWADAASIEVLQYLVDRLADRPLMLVVTHRPAFDAGALVTSRATHSTIRLTALSPVESRELLSAMFGAPGDVIPGAVRELILARAGGHPLFLEEVVRSLVERGALVKGERGWECAQAVAALDIPPTVEGLLRSRLDRLAPDVRRLVQEAAVLGPVFDPTVLGKVSSDPAGVEAALLAGEEAGIVEEVAHSAEEDRTRGGRRRRWTFTQALMQEVAYQSLLVRRRAELHGRIGRAILASVGGHPERLEDLEALGHHLSMAGERLEGARYLMAAGDRARRVYANDDAVRHYERALGALGDGPDGAPERLAACERLGELLRPLGRRDQALAHLEEALREHRRLGDPVAQARLLRKIGGLAWDAGDREGALARFQAGLALLEGRSGDIELAHLYQEMGRLAFRSGDNARALEWAERALEQAAALAGSHSPSTAEVAAHAHNTLGVALARTGRLEEAVRHIERSVAAAEAHDLLQAACRGYTNLGVLYSAIDPQRAIDTSVRGLETAKRIGDLALQSRLQTNLAVAYCALTDRCEDEGLVAAQAAVEIDRQLGQLDHLAVPLIVLGQIQQCHGQPEAALHSFREALVLVEGGGEPQLLFPCYDGLAMIHLDHGNVAEAEAYMEKAQQICERSGLDPDSLVVLPFLD
jgi:predicted ATPase/class 3 adenylate cyclase